MAEEQKNENFKEEKEKTKSRFIGSGKENSKSMSEEKSPLAEVDLESKDFKNDSVKELLEKNLKWSQIIYEQNRKIKRALTWSAVGSWVRIFIFLIPFVIAAVFLWPMYKNSQLQILDMLTDGAGTSTNSSTPNNAALKSLIKVIPLSDEQQKQINTLIDNNNNPNQPQ